MSALLRKELRTVRPFFWLVAALSALSIGVEIASSFPDAHPLDPTRWLESDREDAVISMLLVAFMTGAGLLVNEAELGTLAFVDGLPVSRTGWFAAKFVAGFAVVLAILAGVLAEDVILGWLSRTSISGPFPWRFLAVETGLLVAAAFYVFAAALALSFLRRWLLLGVGLIVWAFAWLEAHEAPHVSLFDPFELARVVLDGPAIHVPWRAFVVQAVTGTVLLVVAANGFRALGGNLAADRGGWRRVFVWIGWGAVPVVWIGVIATTDDETESIAVVRERHPGGERAFGRMTTEHFEFVFLETDRPEAAALGELAEEIRPTVAQTFASPSVAGRIVVDLAGRVGEHYGGQANWKKIRLPLALNPTPEEQRQTLGHELTHVFIDVASNGWAAENFSRTRWYHEGLATFLELRHFAPVGEVTPHERVLAAAHAWKSVHFADLCDDAIWRRQRASELVYSFGFWWCEELVRLYGAEAPGRVTHALADPAVRQAGTSEAGWRATLQVCGYDLERVNAGFDAALDELVERHRDWVQTLPRISVAVSASAAEVIVRLQWEGTAPGRPVVRITPAEPDGGRQSLTNLRPDADGVVRLPRSRYPGPAVWYAAGWVVDGARYTVLEPWAEQVPAVVNVGE